MSHSPQNRRLPEKGTDTLPSFWKLKQAKKSLIFAPRVCRQRKVLSPSPVFLYPHPETQERR